VTIDGICRIDEALSAVPIFVGQAVRNPSSSENEIFRFSIK